MSLRSQLGSVKRHVLGSLYSRCVPLGNRGPIVSFSFDDFPRSAYAVGGAILKGCGVRGTYYTAIGLMNSANELGEQFRRDDLEALVEDGHELASHTFSHISCRSVSSSAFLEDVEKGRTAICRLTGRLDSGNFAFPFGDFTLSVRKLLSSQLRSCRSTWGGLNGPEIDLSLLRANSLYGDFDQAEMAKRLIVENEKRSSWLIFYSHDIRSKPSRFGCTPYLLEAVVSFAVQRGCRIMTVAEVLAELSLPVGQYSSATGVTA
jgi:peptidoglycan/xylan/chitin deacetylase (PgdA/CDA1 family)